ncbi:MAG: ABC transporter substrate-binding protein, partial [Nitrososphaeria archaeon]
TTVPTTSVVTTTVPTTSVVTTISTTTVVTTAPTKKIELSIWPSAFLNSVEEARWNYLLNIFKDTHPDFKVNFTPLPASGDDADRKIVAAYTAGVGFPAICHVEQVKYTLAGYFDKVDDIVNEVKKRWGDDLVPNAIPMFMGPDKKPGYYVIPYGWKSDAMCTRFDIIEKAGLKPEGVVSSFTNFDKSLYKIKQYLNESGLTKEGVYPLVVQLGPKATGDGSYAILRYIATINGIHIATDDGGVHVDQTPEQVKGIETTFATLKRWYDDGIITPDAPDLTEYDNNAYFQTGKCVMTSNAIVSIMTWMDQNKPHFYPWWGVLTWPKSDINGRSFESPQPMCFAISTKLDKEVRDAAKEFILFMLNPENYVKWWGDQGGFGQLARADIPMYKSIVEKPPYTTSLIWKGSRESALQGNLYLSPWQLRPSISKMCVDGTVVNLASAVVLNKMTPKEAAQELIKNVYKYIENMEGLETINKESPPVLPP